jgi:SPP1 family predicted phage head-tail adaptor
MKLQAYDPGWLRHRVTVEVADATPDEAGGESIVWSELATLWARIEPTNATERGVADHLAGVVSHKITFRWRADIEGGMRVAYRGRHFLVRAVHDPDETRRYLVASAEEERT